MQTDEEKLEYRKRVLPGYSKLYDMPDDERETYVVNLVNEALIKEGMAPIDRLLTDEEVEIASQELYGPKKKASFRQRFRRAWAILWAQEI
ncbi:hypothetical protein [Lacticaseibacillus manihotivorans]|uniref:Uncharacterized protein n=2 Tax=Lacticaseibacillus manihotivorans TaxID=88233 RepID=A0A0R1QBX0_9LACO|nr:hypothetical protein [Lacticaseibacillus manihotivorans]KRL42183.1 hypothetical protein FD01_GL001933 [Lacticaseibacillus manihotivorans DSM 13343 = JCM 12514]QFQ91913.1 hypothetical protein LM010_10970 [Lacticaseibacillus manihotivorans]